MAKGRLIFFKLHLNLQILVKNLVGKAFAKYVLWCLRSTKLQVCNLSFAGIRLGSYLQMHMV